MSLKSDADEAYVQLLAAFVDEKIRELSTGAHGAHGARRVAVGEAAVLAALRIADDLFREKRQRAELRKQVRAELQRMRDAIAAPVAAGEASLEDGGRG